MEDCPLMELLDIYVVVIMRTTNGRAKRQSDKLGYEIKLINFVTEVIVEVRLSRR